VVLCAELGLWLAGCHALAESSPMLLLPCGHRMSEVPLYSPGLERSCSVWDGTPGISAYRGTSLIRKSNLLGPYRSLR